MKWPLSLFLCMFASLSVSQETPNAYDLRVDVNRIGGQFQISAIYEIPINICGAYSFLTDYEGTKNIRGIIESKIIARSGNKVKVERMIQERILYIPIEMRSVVEYTETLNQGLVFEQVSGNAKLYKGSWRLMASGSSTIFQYESVFEPGSIIPNAVVEYFIKNSVRERFEVMAEKASQRKSASACL